jgi:hypothetical protein
MKIPLELPPGLNGDDTTFAGGGRWADGSNVRVSAGAGGDHRRLGAADERSPDRRVPRRVPVDRQRRVLNIGFGTHSKLQLWRGGALFDITPASGFTVGAIDGAGSAGYGTGGLAWAATACPRSRTTFR